MTDEPRDLELKMSKARALLRLPGGRRTKWAVLVFWLIVVAVAFPLSGKLTGAEKNDAQSWLPAKAESTQVLKLQSAFQSPNVFPAVVVYDRPSGLTAADRHKAIQDAAAFAGVPGAVQHKIAGPFFAADGKAPRPLSLSTWAPRAGTEPPRRSTSCARTRARTRMA